MKENLALVFDVAVYSAMRQLGVKQSDQQEIDLLISRKLVTLGISDADTPELEALLGKVIGTYDRVEYLLSGRFPHLSSLITLGKVQACLVAIKRNEIALVLGASKEKIDSAFNHLDLGATLKDKWLEHAQNETDRTASWQYMLELLESKMRQDSTAMTIDKRQTITISNSPGIQIGDGNTQAIHSSISLLVSAIEQSDATSAQKEEAKSLLRAFLEHPLVVAIAGGAIGLLG
ncbi:MAG: hypothetical protein MN733_05780 [Nitrososphaera sp.]|nr:hypothetical protein [Nitrososphaera sp.]